MTPNQPPPLDISVLVTGGLVSVLVLIFLLRFLVPGLRHYFRLRSIRKEIRKFASKNSAAEFKAVFAIDVGLAHLWKEYQDSLHRQYGESDGQMVVVATRATVPAELYFNSQFVVDGRLATEFFKHLPGLLTGIGIIGTFGGLIVGLDGFDIGKGAAEIQVSLGSLLTHVGSAFRI